MTAIRNAVTAGLLAGVLALVSCPAVGAEDESVARGRALLRAGDFPAAAASFRAALEKAPDDREARIGLARALGFSGDYAGGEREYRALIAARPGDVEARLGLADILAWRKEYGEARETLKTLEAERPMDPEVLVRQGKLALWSGDRATAESYFRKTLAVDPGNDEASKGLKALAAAAAGRFSREAEAGLSLLRIRRANPGVQAWAGIRDKRRQQREYSGRADYLHRYGKDEGRATAGFLRRWEGGRTARIEAGLSPGADVFSRVAAEIELGMPLARGLAGYAGGKYANYASADVWNVVAAFEYHILPKDALLGRYIFSRTSFDPGGHSSDGTYYVKTTHFFTDEDRAWVYYAHGSEGYFAGTVDQIGRTRADTYGAGGRWYPDPQWGFEGNVEWQDRNDGNRFLTFTGVVYRRF